MTDYNDGNWWGWNGGECPVSADDEVEIQTYGNGCGHNKGKAGTFQWNSPDQFGNVICAFRVTSRAPREFWVINGIACDSEGEAIDLQTPNGGEIIHVREVQE